MNLTKMRDIFRVILKSVLKAAAFVVGLPFCLLLRLIRPFVVVRFSPLFHRIGPCALGMEIYLCERDIGLHGGKVFDMFYAMPPVSNPCLIRMWGRIVPQVPYYLARCILLADQFLPGAVEDTLNGRFTMVEQDVNCVLDQTHAHLSFTEDEEQRGQAALRAMGIPAGVPFVCFHSRDNAYTQRLFLNYDSSFHTVRDSNIENYALTINGLVARGFYAIRMGHVVASEISFRSQKIIDYATCGVRSDFLDIYLSARSAFFLGSQTGLNTIPMIFRRPLVLVNVLPLGHCCCWGRDFVIIPKRLWLAREKRFLKFREILHSDLAVMYDSKEYRARGLEAVENTPEEIRDAVDEMLARLDGKFKATDEDEVLQRRFWSLYEHAPLRAIIEGEEGLLGAVGRRGRVRPFRSLARIGSKFLVENKGLLD